MQTKLLLSLLCMPTIFIASELLDEGSDGISDEIVMIERLENNDKFSEKYLCAHGVEICGLMKKISRILVTNEDVDQQDKYGRTPLHLLCMARDEKRNSKLAQELLARGADINAQDDEGNTVLHFVGLFDKLKLAKFLLQNGADQNICNMEKKTSLDFAQQTKNKKYAKLLIEYW